MSNEVLCTHSLQKLMDEWQGISQDANAYVDFLAGRQALIQNLLPETLATLN